MPRASASDITRVTSARPRPCDRHSGKTATDRRSALSRHTSRPATPTRSLLDSATTNPLRASATPSSGRPLAVSSRSIAMRSAGSAGRSSTVPFGDSVAMVIVSTLGTAVIVAAAGTRRRGCSAERLELAHWLGATNGTWFGRPNESAHDRAFDRVRQCRIEARSLEKRRRIIARVYTRRLDARVLEPRLSEKLEKFSLLERTSNAARPKRHARLHRLG